MLIVMPTECQWRVSIDTRPAFDTHDQDCISSFGYNRILVTSVRGNKSTKVGFSSLLDYY